jgi:hypothetical protein
MCGDSEVSAIRLPKVYKGIICIPGPSAAICRLLRNLGGADASPNTRMPTETASCLRTCKRAGNTHSYRGTILHIGPSKLLQF